MSRIFSVFKSFENQAKISNDNLENLTEEQDKALKDKETVSSTQSKLQGTTSSGDVNPISISYGVSAAKDGFETNKPDHLVGMLSTPPPKPPVHTLAAVMAQSKSAISEFLQGTESNTVSGDMMATMMAYQRVMNKEARQDKKLESSSKEAELLSAQNKIAKDNQAIDLGMKEAQEKADIARQQAVIGLATGVVGGLVTIGAAASSMGAASTIGGAFSELASHASTIKDAMAQKSGGNLTPEFESRYGKLSSLLKEYSATAKLEKQADKLQQVINNMESEEKKQDDSMKDLTDRRNQMRDSILDFLSKLRDLNPKI